MCYAKDYYTNANVLLSHVIAYPSTPENGTNVQKKNAARKHARHYNMIRSLVYSVFNSKSG